MKLYNLPAIILLVSGMFQLSVAQNWQIAWEKQLGSTDMDQFADVIENRSGGYTVLGSTKPEGLDNLDFWLVKFDPEGEVLWSKTFGTPLNEYPSRLVQSSDGNYLLLGKTGYDDQKFSLFAVKADSAGNGIWQKNFGEKFIKACPDVAALQGEEYIILGVENPDPGQQKIRLFKINGGGEIIWDKSYGKNAITCSEALRLLPDGGFAIAGQVSAANMKSPDMYIIRTNPDGDTIWTRRIKTPGRSVWPECVCCSPDNNMIVVGWSGQCMNDINSENPIFDFDLMLCKLSPQGKLLWTKNIDSEGNEGGNAVVVRPDGKILIAGKKETSFTGRVGPWLLLADKEGKIVSEHVLKFKFSNDQASRIINTADGGFAVVGPGFTDPGQSRSRGWIVRFKPLP